MILCMRDSRFRGNDRFSGLMGNSQCDNGNPSAGIFPYLQTYDRNQTLDHKIINRYSLLQKWTDFAEKGILWVYQKQLSRLTILHLISSR